jgi:hypothetical protein
MSWHGGTCHVCRSLSFSFILCIRLTHLSFIPILHNTYFARSVRGQNLVCLVFPRCTVHSIPLPSSSSTAFHHTLESHSNHTTRSNPQGPFSDGSYFCGAKEYGYCDRRSGTCFCNMGYSGIDCSECSFSHFRQGDLCYPRILCPEDCDGAGECDYATGTCHCEV